MQAGERRVVQEERRRRRMRQGSEVTSGKEGEAREEPEKEGGSEGKGSEIRAASVCPCNLVDRMDHSFSRMTKIKDFHCISTPTSLVPLNAFPFLFLPLFSGKQSKRRAAYQLLHSVSLSRVCESASHSMFLTLKVSAGHVNYTIL